MQLPHCSQAEPRRLLQLLLLAVCTCQMTSSDMHMHVHGHYNMQISNIDDVNQASCYF